MCSIYKTFLHVGKKKLLITSKNHEKIPWTEPWKKSQKLNMKSDLLDIGRVGR